MAPRTAARLATKEAPVSKKRSWSTLALLAVAVVSLVLGSMGTATARGITAKSVKKIATKVIKKQAGRPPRGRRRHRRWSACLRAPGAAGRSTPSRSPRR